MDIYRLELADEKGPYGYYQRPASRNLLSIIEELIEDHGSRLEERPALWQDFHMEVLSQYENPHCACTSLDALRTWFEEYFDELTSFSEEVQVVKYTVNKFSISRSELQVIFDKKDVIKREIVH